MPAVPHATVAAPRMVGHMSAPIIAQAPARSPIVIRVGTPHPRTTIPAVRITRRPDGTRRRLGINDRILATNCNAVPGLGFDFPHVAATRGQTAGCVNQFPFFFPFFDGGFFLPNSPIVVEQAPGVEEQVNDAPEVEARQIAPRMKETKPVTPAAPEMASAPQPESEQFVFVRRDGTVFFAIAYAWENGVLRYVTGEGLRQSVAKDVLDLAATQQFNEQRGLNFRSPA